MSGSDHAATIRRYIETHGGEVSIAAALTALDALVAELANERKWIENAAEVNRGLHARLDTAEKAMRAALNELGVPGVGYPAPCANAVEILRAALAGSGETGGRDE